MIFFTLHKQTESDDIWYLQDKTHIEKKTHWRENSYIKNMCLSGITLGSYIVRSFDTPSLAANTISKT